MNEEHAVKMSPLCQPVTQNGKSVQVDIYDDGDGGWLLEVVDEYNNSTTWDDAFETDQSALNEALDAIANEGIDSFIGLDVGGQD